MSIYGGCCFSESVGVWPMPPCCCFSESVGVWPMPPLAMYGGCCFSVSVGVWPMPRWFSTPNLTNLRICRNRHAGHVRTCHAHLNYGANHTTPCLSTSPAQAYAMLCRQPTGLPRHNPMDDPLPLDTVGLGNTKHRVLGKKQRRFAAFIPSYPSSWTLRSKIRDNQNHGGMFMATLQPINSLKNT